MSSLSPSFFLQSTVIDGAHSAQTNIPWVSSFNEANGATLCVVTNNLGNQLAGLYLFAHDQDPSGLGQWRFVMSFADICGLVASSVTTQIYLDVISGQTFANGVKVWRNGALQTNPTIDTSAGAIWFVSIPNGGGVGSSTWGSFSGSIAAQTDLNAILVANAAAASTAQSAAQAAASAATTAAGAAATAQATANAALPATQRGSASGVAPLDSGSKLPIANISGVIALSNLSDGAAQQTVITNAITLATAALPASQKGAASGVATLDGSSKLVLSQINGVLASTNLSDSSNIGRLSSAQLSVGATSGVVAVNSSGAAYLPSGVLLSVAGTALTVTGTLGVNNVLTAAAATGWSVTGYQWTRGGSNIAGATSSTYTQVTADALQQLACIGSGLLPVAIAGTVPGNAPQVTATSSILVAQANSPLTFTSSTVTGAPTPSIVYDVMNGATVVSANVTSGSYTPPAAGPSLAIRTTATNGVGSPAVSTGSSVTVTATAGVAVTYTQLDANRIIQRTATTSGGQSKGTASVPVTLSFSGTQSVYARRRSVADGTTILQGPWMANASAVSGVVTLTGIDVPAIASSGSAPVTTNDGWFYLDLATSASGPWTNGTASITCGRLVAVAGQSLAVRMLGHQDGASGTNTSLGVTISPFSMMLATYNDTRAYLPTVSTMPWAPPADGGNYDSTFTSEFLRRQVQTFGCPVGVIGHAQGGTQITTYFSGGTNDTQFSAVTARAGGAWEAQIWYQGHTEAQYGLPDLPYNAALTTLFARFTALNSYSGFARYNGSIPNITSAVSWGTPFQRRRIRKAHADWAAANSSTHVMMSDVTQIDGIHENQVGAIAMAQAFSRSTRAELALRSHVGPALVSATRSGTTITATLSDVGQGNLILTGTPGNRIHVFANGRYDAASAINNNRFPVSTVTVTNKTTLSIVLANDPGDGHALDLYFYWPNETGTPANDMIRDDITDSDGITVGRQVVPNLASIQIAAPVPGQAVTAPPSGLIAASANSPFNMTATSPVYGAQEQTGFNNTMSGGTATAATNKTPAFVGYTADFWFTCPTIPASTQVFVGGIGSDFLGINSSGKLAGPSSIVGTTTLVAGKRYHARLQRGSGGTQFFLTNITDGLAGVRDANVATAVTTIPAIATMTIRSHLGSFALAGGSVDEVSLWQTILTTPSATTYTAPTAPWTGTEAGLVALYHLDGDVLEQACW